MGIAHEAAKAVGHAAHDLHAGLDKIVSHKVAREMKPTLRVTSPAFTDGAELPRATTIDGAGTPPVLEWSAMPAGTRSVVVFCEDPDAPLPEPYVHWIVYGIPPTARGLDRTPGGSFVQGKNSKLSTGFTPAAPPLGHGVHHYHFQVFALDVPTDLDPGLGRGAILDRVQGHVLAWGEIVATYARA